MIHNSFMRVSRWFLRVLLLLAVVFCPTGGMSDQAQYFYDKVGQLTTVIDGSGNIAVYNYDPVGNLLSIERFDVGASGIDIFLLHPTQGGAGTGVTIRGFGFSPTPTDNQVAFNGTGATVVSSTATVIVATVPSGATTGPVTVTNTNGTATSPQVFTILAPAITSIDPNRVAQGTTNFAVIAGTDLDGATGVQFSDPGMTGTIRPVPQPTGQSVAIDLLVAGGVAPGPYTFTITTPNGSVASGTVTVTVASLEPTFDVALPLSVFRPSPSQIAPSGTTITVAPTAGVRMPLPAAVQPFEGTGFSFHMVSVFKPFPSPVQPQGPSFGFDDASVFKPLPSPTLPSGPSFGLSPHVSVDMP